VMRQIFLQGSRKGKFGKCIHSLVCETGIRRARQEKQTTR
jgi:hypothetical protein